MERTQTTIYFGHTAIGSSELDTEALRLVPQSQLCLNVIQPHDGQLPSKWERALLWCKKKPTCRIRCEKSHRRDMCNSTLWDRNSNSDMAVLGEQVFMTDCNSEHTWTWQEILLTLRKISVHPRLQWQDHYTGPVLLAALRPLPRHSLTLVQMNKTMWAQIVIMHSGWGQNTYEAPNLASHCHFKTCPTGECLSRRLCDAICTMPCTLKYLKPFSLDSFCVCLSVCTTWCQAERSSWTCTERWIYPLRTFCIA